MRWCLTRPGRRFLSREQASWPTRPTRTRCDEVPSEARRESQRCLISLSRPGRNPLVPNDRCQSPRSLPLMHRRSVSRVTRRAAAAVCLTLPSAAAAQLALIPKPREVVVLGRTSLPNGVAIDSPADAADRFAATDLATTLRARGINVRVGSANASARISILRSTSAAARNLLATQNVALTAQMRDEGYALLTEGSAPAHLTVIGATSAGVFYGVQTVKQLIDGDGATATVHRVRVRDWPALRYRGLHDDLSRGPVPTLEFQKNQIRTLAAYKINVYSPYFEQSLSYANNPLIAPPGGAMTSSDVRALVAYAKQFHIEVIPEQEAFGHLHHLL